MQDDIGYHGQQTVKEYLAGDEHRGVTLANGDNQQAVECPAHAGTKGQRIAQRREVEHKMTVHYHHDNTQCRHNGAKGLPAIKALGFIESTDNGRGKQGAQANDDAGVGGCGVVHGAILGEEVERSAKYT